MSVDERTDGTAPTSAEFLVAAAERVALAYPDRYRHQTSGVAFLLSRRREILAMATSFYSYAKRYCAATHNGFGLDTNAAQRRALDYLAEQPARSGPTWVTFLGLLNKARHALAITKARATADFVGDCVEAGQKVVVFNDLDWVPANHWQAEDRIHRIGQTQTSFVTHLYTPGTLDEFVANLLESKAAIVGTVEAEAAAQSSLIDTVVRLAVDGIGDAAEPATPLETRPTMGLLDETLDLLEQFGLSTAATVQSGVQRPGFAYGGNCKHARESLRR